MSSRWIIAARPGVQGARLQNMIRFAAGSGNDSSLGIVACQRGVRPPKRPLQRSGEIQVSDRTARIAVGRRVLSELRPHLWVNTRPDRYGCGPTTAA